MYDYTMQFESLKVFCDVARCRSFSQAAQENQVSQSAASQIVLQLENQTPFKVAMAVLPDRLGVDTLYVIVKATVDLRPKLSLSKSPKSRRP